jgi:hypothetical protein
MEIKTVTEFDVPEIKTTLCNTGLEADRVILLSLFFMAAAIAYFASQQFRS